VVGRLETGDIPDLGHDRGGDGDPDARDRQQALQSMALAEERLQLVVGGSHLLGEFFDDAQASLNPPLGDRRQSESASLRPADSPRTGPAPPERR
jgi:hypothetical protein